MIINYSGTYRDYIRLILATIFITLKLSSVPKNTLHY